MRTLAFELQGLVERRAPLDELNNHVARFKPFGHEASTQERQVLLRAKEVVVKAMQFEGKFDSAEKSYIQLMDCYPLDSRPARFMASYTETLCEKDESQRALRILGQEFEYRQKGAGRRLELSLAHAHLTKAVWQFLHLLQLDQESTFSLNEAQTRYKSILGHLKEAGSTSSRNNKESYVMVCTGLAMVAHTRAVDQVQRGEKSTNCLRRANSDWQHAQAAARDCWPPGYSEMLTLYIRSELAYLLEDVEADNLGELARQLYYKTGRQFYFVAHGTVWLELLERWAQRGNRLGLSQVCIILEVNAVRSFRLIVKVGLFTQKVSR